MTYNRSHKPAETPPDTLRLRALHDETEDDDFARARKRKKPWRYRWPDNFRDEVLARLLSLNHDRASEEGRSRISSSFFES